jgi:hypothetical protein
MRLLKNKTNNQIQITCGNVTQIIDPNTECDLAQVFPPWELTASNDLLNLLALGEDKVQLNDLSMAEAIDLVRGYATRILAAKTSDNLLRVSSEKPTDGKKLTLITPDWGDKTTWYYKSRKFSGTLANLGDDKNFVGNGVWVDNFHGKYTGEDFLKNDLGQIPRLKVYVNGLQKTEVHPHTQVGDYVVDYNTTKVSFTTPLDPIDVVSVDAWVVGSSYWSILPKPGTKIMIELVEAQFSDNIQMNDSIIFQPYVYNPNDLPNKMPYGEPTVYKTVTDFINESNKAYPIINKTTASNPNWRAMKQNITVFNWDYQTAMPISAAVGGEIRIYLEHDEPFEGTATAAFYCRVFDL